MTFDLLSLVAGAGFGFGVATWLYAAPYRNLLRSLGKLVTRFADLTGPLESSTESEVGSMAAAFAEAVPMPGSLRQDKTPRS